MSHVEFQWSVGDTLGGPVLPGGGFARFSVVAEIGRNGRAYVSDDARWMSNLSLCNGDGDDIELTDATRELTARGIDSAMREMRKGSGLREPTEMDRMIEHAERLHEQDEESAHADYALENRRAA